MILATRSDRRRPSWPLWRRLVFFVVFFGGIVARLLTDMTVRTGPGPLVDALAVVGALGAGMAAAAQAVDRALAANRLLVIIFAQCRLPK